VVTPSKLVTGGEGIAAGPLRAARLTGGEATPTLQRFLDEPATAAALALWFGDTAFARLRGDREHVKALLDCDIAAIDALISIQVSAILRTPAFRALEATWRGVQYLARVIDKGDRVRVRVLNVAWPEVVRDFERAGDFDRSTLFELIYSQEFGRAGGEPFGLIVGDYHVSHRLSALHPTDDIGALKSMAATAAAAFAPFVCGCSPELLGLESFRSLSAELDLEGIFRHEEYGRWHGLRELEDARFVGLCLPHVLLRPAWSETPCRAASFHFREERDETATDGSLWGNAAFAFAAVAIRAFVQTGWFAEIRGVRRGEAGGGLVAELPVDSFTTDTPPIAFKYPVEVAVSDRMERRLSDCGFIPLSIAEYVPAAVLYSNQSLHRPRRYTEASATANAQLSSMLQYMLCVARFAQAMKMIGRERIAAYTTAADCQTLIQKWLMGYVTANTSASLELRTKFPLREGRATVFEDKARPGILRLDVYLRPHLQLDDISSGIRLTSELTTRRVA
jgi:type VI secretion system protein ImpD